MAISLPMRMDGKAGAWVRAEFRDRKPNKVLAIGKA